MDNVLNISNTGQALSDSLRTHVGNLDEENFRIFPAPSDVLESATEQCNEAMDVVPEDIWNLSCLGCRDPGHFIFTCALCCTR